MSVAIAGIESVRKRAGTTYWHSDQWFDRLADYSRQYEQGITTNVCGHFRTFESQTPNRQNIQTLRDFIVSVSDHIMPAELKAALLAHLDAILALKFKRECRHQFSQSLRAVRNMQDVSAASCFQNSFCQAANCGL